MTRDPWYFQRWAMQTQVGSAIRKLLLTALAVQAETNTGVCHPSQATLAEWCETTDRTIRTHLVAMEHEGLVARRRRHGRNGHRTTDDYLLLAPGVTHWPDGEPALPEDSSARLPEADGAPTGSQASLLPEAAASEQNDQVNGHMGGTTTARARAGQAESRSYADARLKIGGKPVSAERWHLTRAVLGLYNAATGSHLGAVTGSGDPSESAKRIYGVVTAWPQLTLEDHERIIEVTLREPWWEGAPSVGVIYGPRVFERNLERSSATNGRGRTVRLAHSRSDISAYGRIDIEEE